MTGYSNNETWINRHGTWVLLAVTIGTFIYYGVIEGNTAKNKIAVLESKSIEQDVKISIMEKEKVSKETFILIMSGQVEIKASIEKTNTLLLDHILKGK